MAERWLNRNVVGMGVTSLLSDLGHEMGTVLLPSLVVSLGAGPAALGLIEGVADGLSSFAKLGGGWLADRPRLRKPLAVAGYLVTGAAQAAFALAAQAWQVGLARTTAWFARGLRGPARDALLADSVPAAALGRAFGFHRALDTVGAVLGPLAAGLLAASLATRQIFLVAAVPGMLAALAFALLVRGQAVAHWERRPLVASLRGLDPRYRRFLVAVGLFGLGDFAPTLLILRATELLGAGRTPASAAAVGAALFALRNAVEAVGAFPAGALADRTGRLPLLVVGYAVGAVSAITLAFSPASLPGIAAVFLLSGLCLALQDTLESSVAAELLPVELRGTGLGALAAVNAVGDLASSALVGVVWALVGPAAAFGLAAMACGMGTLVLALEVRRSFQEPPREPGRG